MTNAVLLNFINLFVFVFNILLLARVLMSWFSPNPTNPIGRLLIDVTDPILMPIKKILPQSQTFDFSPLVAYVILQVAQLLANRWLAG